MELFIHQGHELIGGALLPIAPGSQQARDFVLWGRAHPVASGGGIRRSPEVITSARADKNRPTATPPQNIFRLALQFLPGIVRSRRLS
jgi:hypothetical protein